MVREYLHMNVYDAFLARMHFLFEEFDHIYVSFSGGKDSGLLLNLVLDYRNQHYPERAIGVFHQDFEAQYTVTTEYVERTFERIKDQVEPYWVCLPMATRTALSSYEMYWYPWDDTKKELWVREMPQKEYVINLENNRMTTYRYRMHQEDLAKQFGRWYRDAHDGGKTVCLLGMRADESLQRYSGFLNKKYGYKDTCWISKQFKDVWCASPLYDWSTDDVWHATYLFGYDYNRLYDLYYMAGLKPSQMRVASPFNDYAKDALNLYRVIDPEIWCKLVGRVQGANFASIYGKSKAIKEGNDDAVKEEIRLLKKACGDKILKVIVETCLLTEEEKIRMCRAVTEAGADFIKTSTGFSAGGATFEDVELFKKHVGEGVKIKAAGGIASFDDAERFLSLGADRLGTSRLIKIIKEE